MKILQKTFAVLLVICMMYAFIPSEFYLYVYNDVRADILGDGVNLNNGGGKLNAYRNAGVVDGMGVRVTLSRDKDNYLNGTQERRDAVVDTYRYRYPKVEGFNNSMYFYLTNPHEYHLAFAELSGSQSAIQHLGTQYDSLIMQISRDNSKPQNWFKNWAWDKRDVKEIFDLGELRGGKWKEILPSYSEAIKVINYIFGGASGDVRERMELFVDQGTRAKTPKLFYGDFDVESLTDEDKFDLAAGYVGLLASLYVVAKNDSSTARQAVAANYEIAIEDYITNNNVMDKPVTLVVDGCAKLVNDNYYFIIPTIDFIQYALLADENTYSITDDGSFIKLQNPGSSGSTREMLLAVARASAKYTPFQDTYAGTGEWGKPLRLLDNPYQSSPLMKLWANSGSNEKGSFMYGRDKIVGLDRHYAQVNSDNTATWFSRPEAGKGYPGYLGEFNFDGDIYGFIIAGVHIASPSRKVHYYVDSTEVSSNSPCSTDQVSPKKPVHLKLYIEGNSALISSIEARTQTTEGVSLKLEGKITRSKTVLGKEQEVTIIETEKEMPAMSSYVNKTIVGEELRRLLGGEAMDIIDATVLSESFARLDTENQQVLYEYFVTLKITLDDGEEEFEWKEIVDRTDAGLPFHTAVFHISNTRKTGDFGDIIIPAKSKDPSANEYLNENTGIVTHMDLTTGGMNFAEIKHNTLGQEKYEAMGGVPSSEELYYSVGGTEFRVSMYLQYWVNQHSRDRTYHIYFDANRCEFNNQTEGKGDRLKEWHPEAQPDPAIGGGHYDDDLVQCTNADSSGSGDWTILATWQYTSSNHTPDAALSPCPSCGTPLYLGSCEFSGATDEHSQDLEAANKLAAELNAEIVYWTAASDGEYREEYWHASVSDSGAPHDETSHGDTGSPGCGGHHDCTFVPPPDFKGTHSCGPAPCNPGGPCQSHSWTIQVHAYITPHFICGPCCGHNMPAVWDTWRQGLVFDYVRINQVRLYQLDQGAVQGAMDVFGTDEIFANVRSGNPTFFFNMAELNERLYKDKTSAVTPPESNSISSGKSGIFTYGANPLHNSAQSSRDGRIRYTLPDSPPGGKSFNYTIVGEGSSGSFSYSPSGVAAPTYHDDVIYTVGKRSAVCDGMATTSNFAANGSKGPNYHPQLDTGHENPWGRGVLYTHIENNDKTNFSSYYWSSAPGVVGGSSYGDQYLNRDLKQLRDNDEKATNGTYLEDYDHHRQPDPQGVKTMYSDMVDGKDMSTAEWQFFDACRNTPIVAHVISDFLILQTSGGDQAAFYYEKETPATVAQEHFQKLKISGQEILDGNPLSVFVFNKCAEGGYKYPKEDIELSVVVGGYNGRYDEPGKKYMPYCLVTDEFITMSGSYNATKKTGTYNWLGGTTISTLLDSDPANTIQRPARNTGGFKIYQDNLQIIPTTENALYEFGDSQVFYEQVIGAYCIAGSEEGPQDFERNVNMDTTYGNVKLGWGMQSKYDGEWVNQWGQSNGVSYNTVYYRIPTGDGKEADGVAQQVNNIVIHTPVSVEDAIVLNQGNVTITNNDGNSVSLSRDQRINAFDFVNKNDLVNALKICPLDPALCEFRELNCKYVQDNLMAEFDFEPNYQTQDRVLVDMQYVNQTVTKKNTYLEDGVWYTTNKVTGKTYALPANFTVESAGQVGSGQYLKATGQRWSIPLNDLGISTAAQNRVKVSADFTLIGSSTNTMFVGFQNYGFLLQPTNSSIEGSYLAKSYIDGHTNEIGTRKDVSGNNYNKVHLDIIFGFNNVVDCYAMINGVPCSATVTDLRETWGTTTKNGQTIREKGLKNLVIRDETWDVNGNVTAKYRADVRENELPPDIKSADIGFNLNIGGWGWDNAYKANYYLDNLKITLMGGTLSHTSACYEQIALHEKYWTHVHTSACYAQEDIYTCGNPFNTHVHNSSCNTVVNNYQVNSPGHNGSTGAIKVKAGSTVTWAVSNPHTALTHDVMVIYINGSLYYQGYASGSYTFTSDGTVSISELSHCTCNAMYIRITGTLLQNCNGAYNAHTHTSSCSKISKGSLVCTGELNTQTDYNKHTHTVNCLYTYTNIPPQQFSYQGAGKMVYTVPWTDYYTLEVYGASTGYTGAYAKGKVYLQEGTKLYVFVGGKDGTNGYRTDIRTMDIPSNSLKNTDSQTAYDSAMAASTSSILVYANNSTGWVKASSTNLPITDRVTKTNVHSGNGYAVITCANTNPNPTILDQILSGAITEEEAGRYLGDELADMIRTKTQVFETYNNFSYNDTKSLMPLNNHALAFYGNNAVIEVGDGYEFYIPVNIGAKALRAIRVTLDNNSTASSLNVGLNGDTEVISSTMLPNKTSQEIVLDVSGNTIWRNTNINSLYFDIPALDGTVTISKIELVGHAKTTQNVSGYTNNRLLLMSGFTNGNTYGFVGSNNATISLESNNLRVTATGSDPQTSWTTINSIPTSAVRYIKLDFKNNSGNATEGQLYYSTTTTANNETNSFKWDVGSITSQQTVYIDTFNHSAYNATTKVFTHYGSGWTGTLKSMRFDWTDLSSGTLDVISIELLGTGNTSGTGGKVLTCPAAEGSTYVLKTFNAGTNGSSITLNPGVYKLEVWGAQGGGSGGAGGYSFGTYTITSGSATLYVYVGGQGGYRAGGFNGGGTTNTAGYGGGGGTDMRLNGTALSNRIIVAGGGGGQGPAAGGYGGGGNAAGGTGGAGYGAAGTGGTLSGGGIGYGGGGNGNGNASCAGNGSLGQGGNAWCVSGYTGHGGGGGGGGYYGGGAGGHDDYYTRQDNDDSGGGGGSGYVNTSILTNVGGTSGARAGGGYAQITDMNHKHSDACYTMSTVTITATTRAEKPLTASYVNPFTNETTARKTIEQHFDMIPDYVDGGYYNPIWLCKFQPLNDHVCEDEDGHSKCDILYVLHCKEPHHKNEHYGAYSPICWDACENDENHKNTKSEVKNEKGETLRLANYLQLDEGFTVYFPNIGDFAEMPDKLGLSEVTTIRCKGYINRMDTTRWTREKRVKFPFDVIYHEEISGTYQMYLANTWIELDVPTVYFNFYLVSANPEIANGKVEFECEAINCNTGRGLYVPGASYNSEIPQYYTKELKNFRDKVAQILIDVTGYSGGSYQIRTKAGPNGSNGGGGSSSWYNFGMNYFFNRKTNELEKPLIDAVSKMDLHIGSNFQETSDSPTDSSNDNINPHEHRYTASTVWDRYRGINRTVMPLTSNDNKIRTTNKIRMISFRSLHGAYKSFFLDTVGRIGNFTIVDTEDFRFSNLFKLPVMNDANSAMMSDANNWIVEGIVKVVDEDIQNFYIGDTYDLRLNKASANTRWLDTYGTQAWMTGQITRTVDGGITERDINRPNLIDQIFTSDVNNIDLYKNNSLKIGYDVYTSIETLGNYYGGYLQMIPKIYALKIDDDEVEGMEKYNNSENGKYIMRGTYIPLDVYIEKDAELLLVNRYNNAANGNANINDLDLYDFVFNLDWLTESEKRNYTIEEQERTKAVQEAFRIEVFDSTGSVENVEKYSIPQGEFNTIGTEQYMLLSSIFKYNYQTDQTYGVQRTFVGSSNTYGKNTWSGGGVNSEFGLNKNRWGLIDEEYFWRNVQRWHGKVGLPDSSVFIPTGLEINDENRKWIDPEAKDTHFAIVVTADMVAISDLWTLNYSQPWFKNFTLSGVKFDTSFDRSNAYIKSVEHYPGHKDSNGTMCPHCLPPIIAIYGGAETPSEYDITKTH